MIVCIDNVLANGATSIHKQTIDNLS